MAIFPVLPLYMPTFLCKLEMTPTPNSATLPTLPTLPSVTTFRLLTCGLIVCTIMADITPHQQLVINNKHKLFWTIITICTHVRRALGLNASINEGVVIPPLMVLQPQNPVLTPAMKHLLKQLGWLSVVTVEEHEVFAISVNRHVFTLKFRCDLV